MPSRKRSRTARSQSRNSRSQFAPMVYLVDSDPDSDACDSAAMRLAMEVRATRGKSGKGDASTPAKKKGPVIGAKGGEGAASSGGKKKVQVSSAKGGKMGAVNLVEEEGKSNFRS